MPPASKNLHKTGQLNSLLTRLPRSPPSEKSPSFPKRRSGTGEASRPAHMLERHHRIVLPGDAEIASSEFLHAPHPAAGASKEAASSHLPDERTSLRIGPRRRRLRPGVRASMSPEEAACHRPRTCLPSCLSCSAFSWPMARRARRWPQARPAPRSRRNRSPFRDSSSRARRCRRSATDSRGIALSAARSTSAPASMAGIMRSASKCGCRRNGMDGSCIRATAARMAT
jgi:hypothetical protein